MATYTIGVGDDVLAILAAGAAGDTYIFAAGTHRFATSPSSMLAPRNGDTLTCETQGSATLAGSRLLTGWTAGTGGDTGRWWVGGQTQTETTDFEPHCTSGTACQYPFELWFDDEDECRERVFAKSSVSAGKWFFDDAADRIWVGDNPAGATVTVSLSSRIIGGWATGVEIINLVVQDCASNIQQAAIQRSGMTDGYWRLSYVLARRSHGVGIRMHGGMFLRNSEIAYCSQMGVGGSNHLGGGYAGAPMVVQFNSIHHNNFRSLYDPVWEAGGMKLSDSAGLDISGNHAYRNGGPALWLDINNRDYDIYNNLCELNDWSGVMIEISQGGKVRENFLRSNNQNQPTWDAMWGAILISASHDVETYGNIIEVSVPNARGIVLVQQHRPELQPEAGHPWYGLTGGNDHRLFNNKTYNNTVAGPGDVYDGAYADDGTIVDITDLSTDESDYRGNNRWHDNNYAIGDGSPAHTFFGWDIPRSFTQWKGSFHPGEGTFSAHAGYTPWDDAEWEGGTGGEPDEPSLPSPHADVAVINPTTHRLTWTQSGDFTGTFAIYRCIGVGCTSFTTITTGQSYLDPKTRDFTDIVAGTTYRYKVVSSDGEVTAASAVVTVGIIPTDGSTACTGGDLPDTTPGDTTPEDTTRALPPWVRACFGTGMVPTASDVVDSESWL